MLFSKAKPALRLRARFVAQTDYDREAAVSFQQGTHTSVSVAMTAAYAASSCAGYDLVVPDQSGVPGFDPAWALQPGGSLLWFATRFGGTLGLGIGAVPTDGATQRTAFGSGIITP